MRRRHDHVRRAGCPCGGATSRPPCTRPRSSPACAPRDRKPLVSPRAAVCGSGPIMPARASLPLACQKSPLPVTATSAASPIEDHSRGSAKLATHSDFLMSAEVQEPGTMSSTGQQWAGSVECHKQTSDTWLPCPHQRFDDLVNTLDEESSHRAECAVLQRNQSHWLPCSGQVYGQRPNCRVLGGELQGAARQHRQEVAGCQKARSHAEG